MAVEHDPFTQIVNVQWGEEGVFVGGDRFGNIFYLEPPPETAGPEAPPLTLTITKPFSEMAYLGSAFALIGGKPVFVLLGDYVRGTEVEDHGTAIVASRDGKSWKIVLDKPNEFDGSDPPEAGDKFTERQFNGVVFDPRGREEDDPPEFKGRFYAVAYTFEHRWPADEGIQAGDHVEGNTLYSSTDGFSWSEIGKAMTDTSFTELPLNTPSLIEPHCTDPKNAAHIPDGFQAYDPSDGTMIRPSLSDPGFTVFGLQYKTFPPSAQVIIKVGGKPGGPTESTVSMPCYAVAQAGGTWLAVGGSPDFDNATAMIDMGGPDGGWTNIVNEKGKGPIATMTAGSV